ncbi:hypothetical protein BKA82DRAFT_4093270 [Pisolithus tinctorius]|nr:hypothetical protein BKA82DRAFT_4093270 [Pisolithus tinctorius]
MHPAGAKSKRKGRDLTHCATGQDAGHRKRHQIPGPQHEQTAEGDIHAAIELENELLATDCRCDTSRENEVAGGTDPEHRLTSERLQQWGMHMHVDHVFDLVPFWRQAVDAAERGEELRLEEFLEKMEGDGGWTLASDVWNLLADQRRSSRKAASDLTPMGEQDKGWGIVEDWAMHDSDGRSNKDWDTAKHWTTVAHDHHAEWNVAETWDITEQTPAPHWTYDDPHDFVDSIARQEAVSEERRKQMHMFFQMPTEQKIRKIQEIIKSLHTQHRYP